MTKQRKVFLAIGACTAVLCACGAAVLWTVNPTTTSERAVSGFPSASPATRVDVNQTLQVPPGVLNSAAQQELDSLKASDKALVSAFLAGTPGPLDNYLLNLEGMTDMANARYGVPNPESWARALPIARVLEQGMCDCHQRNWLNQFITLGEAGLTGDLANYHAQGEVMAGISRFNDDSVDKLTVTANEVQ